MIVEKYDADSLFDVGIDFNLTLLYSKAYIY